MKKELQSDIQYTGGNLQETYHEISKQAEGLLDAEYSSILLEQNGILERVFSSHPIISSTKVRKNGRTYKSFHNGKIYIYPIHSKKDIHPKQYILQVKSIAFIPLIWKNKKIGILNVLSRKEPCFTQQEWHLLTVLGTLACVSIRNAQLLEENKNLLSLREIFFAAASHELKTPLTTIKLYGQLLNGALTKGKQPSPSWGSVLVREVTRVTRLINEFWLTDQIKSGHMVYSRKRFRLQNVISEAILEFRSSYPNPVTFKNSLLNKNEYIYADFDRILGALTNILNNAGKHSPIGSEIIVTLKQARSFYVIKIKDKGRGIPKKDRAKIFDAFYKGSKQEGIGMGLYLAKSIIDAHKGQIKIASIENRGTTVTIYLPEKRRLTDAQYRTAAI
jgi:K+-sensing histidine kinase KdpD